MNIDTQRLREFAGKLELKNVDVALVIIGSADYIDTQAAEIARLREALLMPTDKPSTWPMSAAQFETAAEFIAMELAEREGYEVDDKHALIWEGIPPEPWGEVWQRYIPDAQSLLSAGVAGIQESERRGMTEDAARAALAQEQP